MVWVWWVMVWGLWVKMELVDPGVESQKKQKSHPPHSSLLTPHSSHSTPAQSTSPQFSARMRRPCCFWSRTVQRLVLRSRREHCLAAASHALPEKRGGVAGPHNPGHAGLPSSDGKRQPEQTGRTTGRECAANRSGQGGCRLRAIHRASLASAVRSSQDGSPAGPRSAANPSPSPSRRGNWRGGGRVLALGRDP